MELYYWFTDLINFNHRIVKISGNLKKTDKKLSMNIMVNMCEY